MPDTATIPQGDEQAGVDAVARFMQSRDNPPVNQQPEPAPVEAIEEAEQQPNVSDQIEGEPVEANQPETETEGDEVEVEAEAEEKPAEEEAEPDEDFVMPASIEEFAELAETPVDELLDSMTIRTKVRGEVQDVPLSDLKAGWQKGADYERRVAAHQEEVAADKAREKERSEQHQQSLAYLGHAVNAYAGLLNELNDDLIDTVRSNYGDDAGRLVNRIRSRLTEATNGSVAEYNKQVQQYQEQTASNEQEAIASNTRSFLNAHPEFQDQKKGMSRINDLGQYLLGRGMSQEAIKGLWATPGADVTISVMLDAMDAQELKEQTKVVKRKIKGLSRKQVKPQAMQTEGMKKAKRKRGVADLVNQASAQPKNSNLQRAAGVEAVRQYMENR